MKGGVKLYKFNGVKVETKEAEKVLGKFKDRYINKSYPERVLFINHLNKYDKTISFDNLHEIHIDNEKSLYMYHERLKTLYITNFKQICLYVEQLEPWEEIDCLIFDEELNWFLGLNHDEKVLIYKI